MSKSSKKTDSKSESNKVDTRYYDELFKRLKDDESDEFNDKEASEIFYNNIIEQISEDESELKKCLNSFHIDYFIFKSNLTDFVRIFQLLVSNEERMKEFTGDRRISRAYEACLLLIADKINQSNSETATESYQENIQTLKSSLSTLGKYLVDGFGDIIETQNGIFTLRSFLRVIGESDLFETQISSNTNKSNKKGNKSKKDEFSIKNLEIKVVPNDWKLGKFIQKFAKNLKEINILEMGLVPAISPFISLLLRKLNKTYQEMSDELVESIHKQFTKKSNSFHSMIQDSIGSRFIESYLYVCNTDLLVSYYLEEHIITNIVAYSKHIYANYPIQMLVKYRIHSDSQFTNLYDNIVSNLGSIIDLHTDLIFKNYLLVELINACQKCSFLDLKSLVKVLMEYLGCDQDEYKLSFLRILLVYEKLEDIQKECTVDQTLYCFDVKPIAIQIASKLIESDEKSTTKGFSNLNSNELEHLCTNNVGSHFIQQCLKIFHSKDRSLWIQQFLDNLKGRFSSICMNCSGSFVMETIWSIATLKQRLAIVDELKICEVQLKNDQYAKFFVNNIGLNFYKRKPDEWKQIQTNEFKKRKMFSDILEDGNSSKKIKKNIDMASIVDPAIDDNSKIQEYTETKKSSKKSKNK